MTTEEKAKRYDLAIEAARCIYNNMEDGGDFGGMEDLEVIFPELKESEDERIRKCLLGHFSRYQTEEVFLNSIKMGDIVAWLEKQGMSYGKRDIDDAYLKGVTDTKNEIEKQYEETYQIRKDIATFLFYYRGDIKDRAKWMNYLGFKVSFVEKQGERKPQGKADGREHL